MKTCIKCGHPKEDKEFYSRPDNNQLLNTCKACRIEYNKSYRLNGPKLKEKQLSGLLLHCNKCDADKDTSNFIKRNGRQGYYQPCKACKREYESDRRLGINKRSRLFKDEDFALMMPFTTTYEPIPRHRPQA